jgi:hypothetical protein
LRQILGRRVESMLLNVAIERFQNLKLELVDFREVIGYTTI